MQNEPVEVTLKVTEVFEKLSVPYLIGGSLASTLYGMIRTMKFHMGMPRTGMNPRAIPTKPPMAANPL